MKKKLFSAFLLMFIVSIFSININEVKAQNEGFTATKLAEEQLIVVDGVKDDTWNSSTSFDLSTVRLGHLNNGSIDNPNPATGKVNVMYNSSKLYLFVDITDSTKLSTLSAWDPFNVLEYDSYKYNTDYLNIQLDIKHNDPTNYSQSWGSSYNDGKDVAAHFELAAGAGELTYSADGTKGWVYDTSNELFTLSNYATSNSTIYSKATETGYTFEMEIDLANAGVTDFEVGKTIGLYVGYFDRFDSCGGSWGEQSLTTTAFQFNNYEPWNGPGWLPEVAFVEDSIALIQGENLYFAPNNDWIIEDARFAAYLYSKSGKTWVDLVHQENGLYKVVVPDGEWTNVIFCRMKPTTTTNNWDNMLNRTDYIAVLEDKNYYSLDEGTSINGKWLKYGDYNFMTHSETILLRAKLWSENIETNSVAACLWSNSNSTWLPMTHIENTNYFEVNVPNSGVYTNLKFAQMNGINSEEIGAEYINLNNYTYDINYDSNYNVYEIQDDYIGSEPTTCTLRNTKVGEGYFVPADAKAQLSLSYMSNEETISEVTRVGARLGSGPIKSSDIFNGITPYNYGVELTINGKTITREWSNESVGRVNADGTAYTGEGVSEYIQWSIALDNIPEANYATDLSYKVYFQVSEDTTKYYLSERTTNVASLAETYYTNAESYNLDALTTAACKIVAGIA